MDGGLAIYNNSGTIQIDSTYRNLTYIRTRNIAAGKQIVTYPTDAPRMIAMYSTTGIMFLPAYEADTYFANGSGQFYDFEDAEIIPTHAGLNVYRGDGSICYSSDTKPLRVLHYQSGSLSGIGDQIVYSGVIAAGRKVAVIMGQQPMVMMGAGKTIVIKGLKVVTNESGFVEISFTFFRQLASAVSTTGYRGDLNYDFIIVDITGF